MTVCVTGFGCRPMGKLTTRTEGRCPKAAREGKRGRWAPGSAGAMGIWEADAVQRGPLDAASAAAGKGQRRATSRTGVVTAMVAGRWWVVEGC